MAYEQVGHRMTDHETIAVAVSYAALALAGPWFVSAFLRWLESDEARLLALEIGTLVEEVAR